MESDTTNHRWYTRLDRSHLGLLVLTLVAVALVPFSWVGWELFFNLLLRWVIGNTAMVILAALLPAILAFIVARFISTNRAATWIFGIVLVSGLFVAHATRLAFRV